MKELIVKEYLHLNRKRRHLQRRIEKEQQTLIKTEFRIKEIEQIMRGETKHESKNTVFEN